MRRSVLLAAAIMLWSLPCLAQENPDESSEKELSFINHLTAQKHFHDAIFVTRQFKVSNQYKSTLNDSVNYLMAWNYFNVKQLDSASHYFLKIKPGFSLYNKTSFYGSYSELFDFHYNDSKSILDKLELNEEVGLNELKSFQLAAAALLERDTALYRQLATEFTYNSFSISKQEERFDKYYNSIVSRKKKSPFLAGMYSALVPGMGKLYLGHLPEGIAAFAAVSAFGGMALENYLKSGIKDPQTLIFGSLFSLFYIGNIWGSVVKVKVVRDDFNHEINHNILVDLHLALRAVFD